MYKTIEGEKNARGNWQYSGKTVFIPRNFNYCTDEAPKQLSAF